MKRLLLMTTILVSIAGALNAQGIIYVKPGGTGNGSSWNSAYGDLQAAIAAAAPGDQVWVAAGTYLPASGQPFVMAKGVKIYGGFTGNENSLADRDWQHNATILHGNGSRVINNYDNGLDTTARLDGFTITGGKITNSSGGGMFCYNTSPFVANCVFEKDTAYFGGAVCTNSASPVFYNCLFTNDTAQSGGAFDNDYNASAKLINCRFINNAAQGSGGAIDFDGTLLTVVNCIFSGNRAGYGGGAIMDQYSPMYITNSLLTNNYAGSYGAALFSLTGSGRIHNCTITGNTAGNDGAAMFCQNTSAITIDNSIIWKNNNGFGNSISSSSSALPTVTYSILDENYFPERGDSAYGGDGNTNADPMFADAANGNYRLQSVSSAIDAGINDSLPAGDTLDLAGNPRITNGTVDMGAYEATVLNRIRNNGDSTYSGLNGSLNITGSNFGNGLSNTYKWQVIAVSSTEKDTLEINPADYSGYKSILALYGITFDSTDFMASDLSKLPALLTLATGSDASYWQHFTGDIYFSRIVNPGNSTIDSVTSNVEKIQITAPLPVTIENFAGTLRNGIASLQWQTGVENNFNHFEIDKSTDGKSFALLASIQPKGNNSNYAYDAPQPEPTAYYRLKGIDNDGAQTAYQSIIALTQNNNDRVLVYPNPATDYINVKVGNAGSISIYDAAGRLVKQSVLNAGVNKIDIQSLGKGIYFGKINNAEKQFKFIKE